MKLTTDEWVAENALGLAAEIACHLKVMAFELDDEDRTSLLRLVMISIRQWDEENAADRLAEWDGE